jgi:hypothetical protein
VVSKKEIGNKTSLMVLTVEYLIVKQEIFTLDPWRKASETVEEDSMMLKEMKYMMETLR